MTLAWFPERLTATIYRAYAASLKTAEADAKATAPSHRAGVELRGTSLVPTDLGSVFELGRRGGYSIAPKDALVLKFPNGTFATFATGGAMGAEPYIWPAAQRWAHAGFQATARVTLAASGF
jgi:hypothetical protein